eukprot:2452931-Pyramimonas_sp.AAC.1
MKGRRRSRSAVLGRTAPLVRGGLALERPYELVEGNSRKRWRAAAGRVAHDRVAASPPQAGGEEGGHLGAVETA